MIKTCVDHVHFMINDVIDDKTCVYHVNYVYRVDSVSKLLPLNIYCYANSISLSGLVCGDLELLIGCQH